MNSCLVKHSYRYNQTIENKIKLIGWGLVNKLVRNMLCNIPELI